MKCFFILLLLVSGCSMAAICQESLPTIPTFDKNVKILFKPKPSWGDGQDCSVGTVILRIEFLESGKIGKIDLVKGINKNRNEKSIEAAQKIRFRPAKKDGKNITAFRQVEFPFYI